MDNQKQHYLLSIDKKQIFFISLAFSLTLALFFLVGLNFGGKFSIGEKISEKENYINASNDRFEIMDDRLDRYGRDNGGNFDKRVDAGGKTENIRENMLGRGLGKVDEKSIAAGEEHVLDKADAGIVFENYLDSEKLLEQENLLNNRENNRERSKRIAGIVDSSAQNQPLLIGEKAVGEKAVGSGNSKKFAAYETKPLPGVDYFFIQIIATEDLAKAKRIASELTDKKYLAVVHKSLMEKGSSKKQVFLVRIGLYKDKEIAKLHLKEISSLGAFSDAFIARYREQS